MNHVELGFFLRLTMSDGVNGADAVSQERPPYHPPIRATTVSLAAHWLLDVVNIQDCLHPMTAFSSGRGLSAARVAASWRHQASAGR